MKRWAATIFAIVIAIVILFQLALAGGAPWGEYALGGVHPGRFPPRLRVAAALQALLLAGFMTVILKRAGLLGTRRERLIRALAWVVVGLSGLSLVLNTITPSEKERAVWAPAALVMLVSSLVVVRAKDK